MKNLLPHILTTAFMLLVFTSIGFAQLLPPGGGAPPPGGCFIPPCVPIDGGISLLIAAGAAFGAYSLKKKNPEA